LKSLQNFVKKFEKGLNGFEFKRFDLKEFEKEKEKKRKDLTSLSARNGPPAHLPSPAMTRLPTFLLLFSLSRRQGGPTRQASFSFLPRPFPFLCSAGTERDTTSSRASSTSPLPSVGFNQEP
jgi:hypothetical protein